MYNQPLHVNAVKTSNCLLFLSITGHDSQRRLGKLFTFLVVLESIWQDEWYLIQSECAADHLSISLSMSVENHVQGVVPSWPIISKKPLFSQIESTWYVRESGETRTESKLLFPTNNKIHHSILASISILQGNNVYHTLFEYIFSAIFYGQL